MKNLYTALISVSFIFNTAISTSSQQDYKWVYWGLDDKAITCMTTHDNQRVLAGTEAGLYLYKGDLVWENVLEFPVKAMAPIDSALLMVIVIADSYTQLKEGVYTGDSLNTYNFFGRTGFPPGFHSFTAGVYNNEQAVVFGYADTIIYQYVPAGIIHRIPLPQGCFGTGNPYCSFVHIDENENMILAGGYDLDNTEQGAILQLKDKQMVPISSLEPLTIKEIQGKNLVGLEKGTYISTIDSGLSKIISYNPFKIKTYETPDINKIKEISILNMPSGFEICLLNDETSYSGQNDSWIPIPALMDPNTITCLSDYTIAPNDIGLAGTERGVCHIEFLAEKTISNNPKAPTNIIVKTVQKQIAICYDNPRPQNVSIDIFNPSGKKVVQVYDDFLPDGQQYIKLKHTLTYGTYFVHVRAGERTITKKIVILKYD